MASTLADREHARLVWKRRRWIDAARLLLFASVASFGVALLGSLLVKPLIASPGEGQTGAMAAGYISSSFVMLLLAHGALWSVGCFVATLLAWSRSAPINPHTARREVRHLVLALAAAFVMGAATGFAAFCATAAGWRLAGMGPTMVSN